MTVKAASPSSDVQSLLADARRLGDAVAALRPVLEAFTPVFVAQRAAREQACGWSAPLPEGYAERFSAGVPVLSGHGFMDASPWFVQAAGPILRAMEQGLPAIAQSLRCMKLGIETGEIAFATAAQAALASPSEPWCGVDPDVFAFASRMILRPLLARQAEDLAGHIQDLPWQRPYCPICGGKPDFSMLRRVRDEAEYISGHGGVRFLRCSTCETQWRYKRISCPDCGNEEPERLTVLHAQTRPFERLDVCEACKAYCPCLDAGEFVETPDSDIALLAMLPLEMLVRPKGYHPLAAVAWTV
ncbi:MAG TPA: formate dehydrogenase accessory protein FdhE [Solidesulfovibrio magneticus]|nr:formate dehydrogenase accessory protein FdhE [Solidesulfovibrio magneticus]